MQSGSSLPGILVTAFFGILTIGGMVWNIIHYASSSHEDLHTFPVRLAPGAAGTTAGFKLAGGAEVSVWLLMDSRVMEMKPVVLDVAVESGGGKVLQQMHEDFGFTVRNRYGDHVYYRLGSYTPSAEGSFRLAWKRSGTWATEPAGSLVVRRALPFSLPWPALALTLVGIAGLAAGIRMLLAGGKS